jgi:anti-sigma regulatory factor (Ser/Thr protein kinase)
MGRLRTAVQTLADIDLTPDELLTYLDDLVLRLAASDDPAAMGSTCLYAVYDPVDRRCAIASAGHPPPALVRPDGTVRYVDLTPGPPLGIGGLPFEVATLVLDPHSVLALYTDGLVEDHRLDIDTGMQALSDHLTGLSPGDDLESVADHLMGSAAHRSDDATLLLARVRAVDPADIAVWEVPPAPGTGQLDPAAVAGLRAFTVNRLAAWNAPPALTATAELVVSELVTNAIRYGDGRAALRLLRDGGRLVCEVHDLSSAAPHLKRGKGSSDEGGWGLFIVAQVADRWGVRYAESGKVIWTELGWS